MSLNLDIELKPVIPKEYPTFIKNLQEAFSPAIIEKFGTNEYLPSKNDILSSLTAKNAEVFYIIYNNQCAGGVVLMIDKNTHHNSLDLFFISPKYHGDGLGLATWKTIEKKYPDTITWRTITPYFEQRNIHFYINKCGFHIIEFFNKYHKEKNMPNHINDKPNPCIDNYFLFEKKMK